MKREPNLPRFGRDQSFPETSLSAYFPPGARARASVEPRLAPSAAVVALVAALDRLEETIDAETSGLEAHRRVDLAELNSRKSRSLLELTRLGRGLTASPDPALRERLARLQGKLKRNQTVLKLNLEAVREIGELLLGALGEAESDGTYGMPTRRGGA